MPIDLNQLAQDEKYAVQVAPNEHPDDRAARLAREREDAQLARRKEFWAFLAVMFGLTGIAAICFAFVLGVGQPSADDKKWAFGVLTSMVTGGIGVLTGKRLK